MQLCSAGDYHENLPLNSSIGTTNLFKRGRLKRWAPMRLHSYHLLITTLGEKAVNHLPGILHEIFNIDRDKKCHDARSSITLGYRRTFCKYTLRKCCVSIGWDVINYDLLLRVLLLPTEVRSSPNIWMALIKTMVAVV